MGFAAAFEAKEYSAVWEASFNTDETPPAPKRPAKSPGIGVTAYIIMGCETRASQQAAWFKNERSWWIDHASFVSSVSPILFKESVTNATPRVSLFRASIRASASGSRAGRLFPD
jgi:hypothetical protein